MKKELITGANGMIGSAIVNEFIDKYELVLVDPYTDKIDKFKNKATVLKNSLYDIEKWESNLDGVNTVVHLAAAVHWKPKNKEEEQQLLRVQESYMLLALSMELRDFCFSVPMMFMKLQIN